MMAKSLKDFQQEHMRDVNPKLGLRLYYIFILAKENKGRKFKCLNKYDALYIIDQVD